MNLETALDAWEAQELKEQQQVPTTQRLTWKLDIHPEMKWKRLENIGNSSSRPPFLGFLARSLAGKLNSLHCWKVTVNFLVGNLEAGTELLICLGVHHFSYISMLQKWDLCKGNF